MKKLGFFILCLIFIFLVGCSKNDTSNTSSNTTSKQIQESEQKKYWINNLTDVIHNRTCKWYGKTKIGHYTDGCTGKDCGICGGCK